jgi:hypothetical protein
LKAFFVGTNFTVEEYRCKCGRSDCDAPKSPPPSFLHYFQLSRVDYNRPMIINSWSRCRYYNERIGGAVLSEHLDGNAVDIKAIDSVERWLMVQSLMKYGFTVIVYSTWIHADRRPGKPILLRGSK